MSRVAVALLVVAAAAAALMSRVLPALEWVAAAFIALLTAALLERRARAGRSAIGPALGVAVLLGGGGAAAYAIDPTLAPFAQGAALAAGAALLVALRHGARRGFAFLRTRAAFYGITAIVFSASVLCAVVAANVLAARSPVQVDMTRSRVHSLSEESRAVLADVRRPLSIHVFFRREEAIARASLAPLLERYRSASERVRIEYHDPDRDPRLVAKLGVRFDGPRVAVVAEQGAARITPGGRALSAIDPRDPTRMVHFREFTEADVTNAILRATRTRPRVCFLAGHGEAELDDTGPDGLAAWKRALEDQSAEAVRTSLADGAVNLAGCRAVVIAAPKGPLFPREVAALREHVVRGGGLVLLVEPGTEAGLSALLAEVGIAVRDGTVSDPRGEALGAAVVAPARFSAHPSTAGLAGTPEIALYLDGARPVDAQSSAAVLLESAAEAWAGPAPGQVFDPARDRKGPVPLAAAGAAGKGRVAVVGDADLASNRYLRFAGNQLFAVGLVRWATGEEKVVQVKPHGWQHSRLTWTPARRRIVRVVTQGVLPGLALFFAIYLWRSRRRR